MTDAELELLDKAEALGVPVPIGVVDLVKLIEAVHEHEGRLMLLIKLDLSKP